MDAEERALLAAIIAQPDDDTARLVYADWLQEHGNEDRADLIRAQVWLTSTKGDIASAAQRNEWNARARELLRTYSRKWRRQLPRLGGALWGPFTRGMVESVKLSVGGWNSQWSEQMTQLLGLTAQRSLHLHFYSPRGYKPEECEEMLRWAGIEQFEEVHLIGFHYLSLDATSPTPFFSRLWAHEWRSRPRVLNLQWVNITDAEVAPLLSVSTDHPLPVLILPQDRLGESIRTALAARFGSRVRFM
jgi:uncharacterized protein (TIGR02996 family)